MSDYKTLEDIEQLPMGMMPMIALSNGFTSLFGYLIGLATKDFWSHFMWLVSPTEFASQWFWFKLFPVRHFAHHSIKFWYNPLWTPKERVLLKAAIAAELGRSKWATRYDVIGVIGEAFGWDWMNRERLDFCSEKIRILSMVDRSCKAWLKVNPSPTPEQCNTWLKSQKNKDGTPKYVVWGRVQPG